MPICLYYIILSVCVPKLCLFFSIPYSVMEPLDVLRWEQNETGTSINNSINYSCIHDSRVCDHFERQRACFLQEMNVLKWMWLQIKIPFPPTVTPFATREHLQDATMFYFNLISVISACVFHRNRRKESLTTWGTNPYGIWATKALIRLRMRSLIRAFVVRLQNHRTRCNTLLHSECPD